MLLWITKLEALYEKKRMKLKSFQEGKDLWKTFY